MVESKHEKQFYFKQQKLTLKSQLDNPKIANKLHKKQIFGRIDLPVEKKSSFFLHLPQYKSPVDIEKIEKEKIPKSIISFCSHRLKNIETETNEDIILFLNSFLDMLNNIKSNEKEIKSVIEYKTNLSIQFISDCIGISIGIGNVIKHLKKLISKTNSNNCKSFINEIKEGIRSFINNRILISQEIISTDLIMKSITSNDKVLVFETPKTIIKALIKSKPKKAFFVLIDETTDEKIEYLKDLRDLNVKCSCLGINSIAPYIDNSTMVIINALSVFSNGSVLARCGSALIALLAHEKKVPVIVTCEAFKLSERVQLDSIVYNELDHSNELLKESKKYPKIRKWQKIPFLKILNMRYDVIPAKLIDKILTEYGAMPSSSVPVIIRAYN